MFRSLGIEVIDSKKRSPRRARRTREVSELAAKPRRQGRNCGFAAGACSFLLRDLRVLRGEPDFLANRVYLNGPCSSTSPRRATIPTRIPARVPRAPQESPHAQ